MTDNEILELFWEQQRNMQKLRDRVSELEKPKEERDYEGEAYYKYLYAKAKRELEKEKKEEGARSSLEREINTLRAEICLDTKTEVSNKKHLQWSEGLIKKVEELKRLDSELANLITKEKRADQLTQDMDYYKLSWDLHGSKKEDRSE